MVDRHVLNELRAMLPENHKGWDCDGSASICDLRVDALRDVLAEVDRLRGLLVPTTEDETGDWEYGAGYQGDTGLEVKWFSMGSGAFSVREAAEHEVQRFSDPQVRLVRRRKPGPWLPVEEPDEH